MVWESHYSPSLGSHLPLLEKLNRAQESQSQPETPHMPLINNEQNALVYTQDGLDC